MNNNKSTIKTLLLTACLLGSTQGAFASWYNPFGSKPTQEQSLSAELEALKGQINPENTALVCDIHGVITRFSKTAAITAAWNMDFMNRVHFTKKTLKYFLNNKNPKRSIEGVILEDRLDNPTYVAQAVALINPHVPKPETVAVLKELKEKKYTIYGCSNIGEKSYEYMQNKYPAAFESFTACRTSNPRNGYVKKGTREAYTETTDMVDKSCAVTGNLYTNLLFIDNKKSNLVLASSVDPRFKALFFKNPKLLRANLENLGIIDKSETK